MDFPHAALAVPGKSYTTAHARNRVPRFVGQRRLSGPAGQACYEPSPSPRLAALCQILLPPEDRASAERGRCGRLRPHDGVELVAVPPALQVPRLIVEALERLDFLLAPEPGLLHGRFQHADGLV